jgi:hypothetical protein
MTEGNLFKEVSVQKNLIITEDSSFPGVNFSLQLRAIVIVCQSIHSKSILKFLDLSLWKSV